MANFSYSQLRAHQLTGTIVDGALPQAGGYGQIPASDGSLAKVLDHMASAIKRIHGAESGIDNAQSILSASAGRPYQVKAKGLELRRDDTGDILGGFTYNSAADLVISGALAADGKSTTRNIRVQLSGTYGLSDALIITSSHNSVVIPNNVASMSEMGAGASPSGLYFGDDSRRIFSLGKAQGLNIGAGGGAVSVSGSNGVNIGFDPTNTHIGMSVSYADGMSVKNLFSIQSGSTGAAKLQDHQGGMTFVDSGNGTVLTMGSGNGAVSYLRVADGKELQFRDADANISSPSAGKLTVEANGSGADAVKVASMGGGIFLDSADDILIDADGDNVVFAAGSDGNHLDIDMGVAATVKPSVNLGMSLGGSSNRYLKVWAEDMELTKVLKAKHAYLSNDLFVSGAAVIEGNVMISGSLDVLNINTVSRTKEILEVVDANVLMASGSTGSSADGAGIIIGGTDVASSEVALLWDNSASAADLHVDGAVRYEFGTTVMTPSADNTIDLGSANKAWKDLHIDGVIYADDVEFDKLQVADTNQSHHLEIDWSEDDTADRVLDFKVAGGDRTVTLNEGFTIGDGNVGTLTFSGASKTLTVADDCTVNQNLRTSDTVTFANATISGVLTASQGARVQDLVIFDADESVGISLKAPASLAANYSLVFPADDGAANQYLKSDGSGNLSWETITGTSSTTFVQLYTGSNLAAGAAHSFNGSAATAAYSTVPTTRNAAGITLSSSELSIMVNGQHMVSGTSSNVSAGTADYTIDSAPGVNHGISFSFPLSSGDLITVKKTAAASS